MLSPGVIDKAPHAFLAVELAGPLIEGAAQEAELRQLIQDQNRPGSSSYHKWLTPAQFGQKFGPSAQDVATLESWLQGQGFNVVKLNPGRQTLEELFVSTVEAAEPGIDRRRPVPPVPVRSEEIRT